MFVTKTNNIVPGGYFLKTPCLLGGWVWFASYTYFLRDILSAQLLHTDCCVRKNCVCLFVYVAVCLYHAVKNKLFPSILFRGKANIFPFVLLHLLAKNS